MKIGSFIFFILILHETRSQLTALDRLGGILRKTFRTFFYPTGDAKGIQKARKLKKFQPIVGYDIPFPCNVNGFRSEIRPTTVHQLRPGDIDIIGAIGDSLTAASGAAASRYLNIVVENRGLAWDIGGQGTWREYLTLANIIKVFNPKLFGYSLGDATSDQWKAQFNIGEIGSYSQDMPYQARVLVKRIKADRRVNFNRDWKLITLMIGANDFCSDLCYKKNPSATAEAHRRDLMKTLDYLRDNLPRTLVNLVLPPNIEILVNFKGKSIYCEGLQILECPCVFGKSRVESHKPLLKVMRKWQQTEEELCLDPRYQVKDDFAVVLQPFVADLIFPERETPRGNETDWSYLSEDCFHFSQKGYARASNALWNNMLEPVGKKSTDWQDTFTRFLCPTRENPYFYTWKSKQSDLNIRQVL